MPSPVTITLTDTLLSSWAVPADWNNQANSITVVAAGGAGANGAGGNAGTAGTNGANILAGPFPGGAGGNGGAGGGAGGQGATSSSTNVTLTPGGSVPIAIGQGGSSGGDGGDTSFGSSVLLAKGGKGAGSSTTGAAGGLASGGLGSTRVSGADGGSGTFGSNGAAGDNNEGNCVVATHSVFVGGNGGSGGAGGAAGNSGTGESGGAQNFATAGGHGTDPCNGIGGQIIPPTVGTTGVGGHIGTAGSDYSHGGAGGSGGSGGGGGGGGWTGSGTAATAGGGASSGGTGASGFQGKITIVYTPTTLSVGTVAAGATISAPTQATKLSVGTAAGLSSVQVIAQSKAHDLPGFMTAPFMGGTFLDGNPFRAFVDASSFMDVNLNFTLYAATRLFATRSTDTPANTIFRGTLQSYSFKRSIAQNTLGAATIGTGTLVLKNDDRAYDFLARSYAIAGREFALKIGRTVETNSYNDTSRFLFSKVMATGWVFNLPDLTISLQDYTYKLQVPAQPHLYGGTGGSDGTSDMLGKRKPLGFGKPRYVTMVLLDPTLHTYQLHDGAIKAVDNVYDRGATLTFDADYATYTLLAAATIAAGKYATCLAQGYVRLESAPAGTPMADFQGENTSGNFLQTTADIVKWFVQNKTTVIYPDGFDTASFTAVNAAQPAPVDFFLDPSDQSQVIDVIANLMNGIGGWGGFTFAGLFEVGIFVAPTGTAVKTFTRADMFTDPVREPLPTELDPPRWRWRVPYGVCWTVQTSDFSGSATAALKAFVAQAYRLAIYENDAILTDYPYATDPTPRQCYFSNESDALAEATRLSNLYKTTRVLYRTKVHRRALTLRLGDIVEIIHPAFDLTQGRTMTLVERTENVSFAASQIDYVELLLYG